MSRSSAVRRLFKEAVGASAVEFALVLPHAEAATATAMAERCMRAMDTLALPHAASPTAAHLTLSVGAALLRLSPREEPSVLVRRAAAALYAAKAAGRARCVLAEEPRE